MSTPSPEAVRRAVIRGALIEAPIILAGAGLAVATGNPLWAIGAAALGMVIIFVLLAQAKKDQER